ncbi:platelet-derived growth factor receptor-like protein [Boleophthalmus pectinirostris]|uniref:platelet-derived growth factor receptor-like protein n=1 Tax=Boleophthalmus pectinirostris TaxID=150288 RepID=UPI0024324265|nr:platelet-derived growth factor receptor-like protein [Boleophthalmus pectinirostris]
MMKTCVILCLALVLVELHTGVCQQPRRKKDQGDSRVRPGKRVKPRPPKTKDPGARGQSLLTQVLEKGRFLRLGNATVLPPGRSVELRCKGSNIGWGYPSYLDTYNDSRLSINQIDKYGQLILTAPSAADTGMYSCWVILCDGKECSKDTDRSYSTYVYFTDKDSLFVPSPIHIELVYLRPDRPAVVPCRVTDPQTQVTLHREVPPQEIPTNGTGVTFDPTQGFVLESPGPELQGVYYCKAQSRGAPQISTKYQLLYVEVPSGAPFVSMETSPDFVLEGDSVNVTCTVLGEPEVPIHFKWIYPNQSSRSAQVHSSWRLVKRGLGHTTRVSQSVLIIKEMNRKDSGSYICKAQNKYGETVVATNVQSG